MQLTTIIFSSFFHIRIQQNPKHYALSDEKDKPIEGAWEEWLDHYVEVRRL